jgi:hypothetical protein
MPNLIFWAAFILFAVTATIAAWWRHSNDQPAEYQRPTQTAELGPPKMTHGSSRRAGNRDSAPGNGGHVRGHESDRL